MKKNLFILTVILLFNSALASDLGQYCSANYPDITDKNFKGSLASVSGVNLLSRKIASNQIKKTLKEETNSDFKVKINNFYGVALTDGIFKDLEIEGKNFIYDDLVISKLNAKTLCPYNYVQMKDDKVTFLENFVLGYNLEISEEDLNKTLSTTNFSKMLNRINQDKFLSKIFKIENISAKLEADKLSLSYKVVPSCASQNLFAIARKALKPMDVNISCNLKVENNKIELCDMNINNAKFDSGAFLPLINLFNPTNQKIKVDKDNEGDLKIESVKILPSKIALSGLIFVQAKDKNE